MYAGYEARLSAEQSSKKEILFEIVCPGRKSYLVSDFVTVVQRYSSQGLSNLSSFNGFLLSFPL